MGMTHDSRIRARSEVVLTSRRFQHPNFQPFAQYAQRGLDLADMAAVHRIKPAPVAVSEMIGRDGIPSTAWFDHHGQPMTEEARVDIDDAARWRSRAGRWSLCWC